MNNKTTTTKDVSDMSRNELASVVYHIAQHTRVSLDYTQRFKRDALLQASELLTASPAPMPGLVKPTMAQGSLPSDLNETILNDYTVDGLTYKIPVKDGLSPRDLRGEPVQTCIVDASVICHCSLGDRLKCSLDDDGSLPETFTLRMIRR